jgi:outer membrane protein OmpA-like peptidoglycan-associated protein
MLWDVFISHATEDKESIALPLANRLMERGLRVWLDRWELKLGDSLSEKIDNGLVNSRFGVVIFSPSFFAKRWPRHELEGLVQRQLGGAKVILPVWHEVDHEYVAKFSPTLANKMAVPTSSGLDHVASAIYEAVAEENTNTELRTDKNHAPKRRFRFTPRIVILVATFVALVGGSYYPLQRSLLQKKRDTTQRTMDAPGAGVAASPALSRSLEMSGKPSRIHAFYAQPDQLSQGQNARLFWRAPGGPVVLLDGALVSETGDRTVHPLKTTTYTIEVQDESGGVLDRAYATVRVIPPLPPISGDRNTINDVFFGPGEDTLNAEAQTRLLMNVSILRELLDKFSQAAIVIEGHADELGSAEENLRVGDRRASTVKDFMVRQGLPADRLRTISFGKSKPECKGDFEECRQKNRRVHFAGSQ